MSCTERTQIVNPLPAQLVSVPSDVTLTCQATTDPSEAHNLRVQWRRNGDVINPAPSSRYVISQDGSRLTIRQSRVADTATYTCRAENGVDFATVEIPVTVRGSISLHITSGGGSYLEVGGGQIEAEGRERGEVLGEGQQPPPHQLGGLGAL